MSRPSLPDAAFAKTGRVIARRGPVFTVESPDGSIVQCKARGRGKGAVVGDDVTTTDGLISDVGPRRTVVRRADPRGTRRALVTAANVDRIFIVVAVEPTLMKPSLIDRYLVAAHTMGIDPVIVVNKVDRLNDEERAFYGEELEPYLGLGYEVIWVSASTGEALDSIRAAASDRLSIFCGQSGVGKSSLLNALIPGIDLRVDDLSDATGKGQHTTTETTLYRLPSGGEIIDSPGVGAFLLYGIEPEAVAECFAEITAHAAECRFANCRHTVEPGCAVLAAVDADLIDERRYESYVRIRESLV